MDPIIAIVLIVAALAVGVGVGYALFYKKGVTDPDYCVLKFTATSGRYYCDLKTESFEIKQSED